MKSLVPAPSFRVIYLIAIIFNYHALLVAFINSTYLERYTSPEIVSMLYSASSLVSIVVFIYFSKIVSRLGNFFTILCGGLLQIIALVALALAVSPLIAIGAFLLYGILNPILYLCLDVFIETIIGDDESATGSRRGLLLALMSLASALAPFTIALLIGDDSERLYQIYLLSSGVGVLFLLVTAYFFRCFKDPVYYQENLLLTAKRVMGSKIFAPVFASHFLLQVFFAWTTVYFPLYLVTEIGFSWGAVGVITGIGLLAYVLLEYPLGVLEDRDWGEKEVMAVGFVIMITACFFMSAAVSIGVVGWSFLMFYSRVGAAGVETATEGYFFKHIRGEDSARISLFRMLRPLGLAAGTLLGTISLFFLPFQYIFMVLGCVLCLGIISTLALKDTK